MIWWILLVVLVGVIGYGMWRLARYAGGIESDSGNLADMAEGGQRAPYGSTWLSILRGRD